MSIELWQKVSRFIGVSLISASVLALQVIFTRIFSIMIWHHFTYLVIGVALLGGGAAGTYLTVKRWSAETLSRRIGRLALVFSISILISLLVITQVYFDPLSSRGFLNTFGGLVVYFISLFAIFFLGGLVIVSAFSLWTQDAHRLYFADLAGAGISMLVVLWLIQIFGGPSVIVLIALLALVAGGLFGFRLSKVGRTVVWAIALAQIALFFFITFFNPIQLPLPASKSLAWALEQTGTRQPEYTRWNPVARVDVTPPITVNEPMIVGGVSSVFLKQQSPMRYSLRFVTLDGTSMTGLYEFDGDLARFNFLKNAIIAAPFLVTPPRPSTLNIGVGGGIDMILARLYDAKSITAIDLNADVVSLVDDTYAEYTGRLAEVAGTTLTTAEGRSFLMRDSAQYDLIQGIGLDNIAALSSGAYVLAESYLYTVDFMDLAIDRLSPKGIFAWTLNDSTPPRTVIRLTGLAAEALRRNGALKPAQSIAIVSNEARTTSTLLISRQPFTASTIQPLRDWVRANQFILVHDPVERLNTPFADYLHASDPRAFEASYEYNIFPVGDDNPYFYNYFKWSNLFFNLQDSSQGIFARLPLGNLILSVMLMLALLAAIAFIVYPLWQYKSDGLRAPYALWMIFYFSLLGLAYIFVEIVLIQRLTLFIGYPTQAMTTTIFGMLFFSAVGSLASERLCITARHLRIVLLALTFTILFYVVALPPLFQAFFFVPDQGRILLSIAFIAPLAFLMGMPFPTGLRRLGVAVKSLVPWAWGMNGVFSVIGSVSVTLVSMQSSFTVALVSAAVFYGIAGLVAITLWRVQMMQAAGKM